MIVFDLETYYSDEYTLKKLTTEAYVRDPRFETLCLGWHDTRNGDGGIVRHDALKTPYWRDKLSNEVLCAWHAHFDGFVLHERYDIRPRLWVDGMLMARYVFGADASVSLAAVAERLGLAGKTVPYQDFKGLRLDELSGPTLAALDAGCLRDGELTRRIVDILAPDVPRRELALIDMTVRMYTEPQLVLDAPLLTRVIGDDAARRESLLVNCGVEAEQLRSQSKFVECLRALDIEPEFKTGKNGPIPALAATDAFVQELLAGDHGDAAQALAEARLAHKSTIGSTRAQALLDVARRGGLPVYLRYFGAHTGRWSGAETLNLQNIPKAGPLRQAIRAPRGYELVTCDLSQIELRVNAYLANHAILIMALAEGRDIYADFAGLVWGRPITKGDPERQIAKVVVLGSGYGMGADRLHRVLRNGGYDVSEIEARRLTDVWRAANGPIARAWKEAWAGCEALAGLRSELAFYACRLRRNELILPDGTRIPYRLEYDRTENGWKRTTRRGWRWFRGCTLVENIVQGTARGVLGDALVRIKNETGLWPVLSSHDDASWLVPSGEGADFAAYVEAKMSIAPTWLPGIPLGAEARIGETYGG